MASVRRLVGFHVLAVEDAAVPHQPPKIERYDDSLFVVLRTLWYVDAPRYRMGKTMRDRWSLAPAAARILTSRWSSMWRAPRVRRTTPSRRPRRDVGHGVAFTAFDEPGPALVQSAVALVSADFACRRG